MRALRVLREAHVVAAEDTRRTAKLLSHYGIRTSTLSFHAHNSRARLPQLLDRLSRGENVALVTDAGTPGISDPGVELVAACRREGIAVDPIPGPSAALLAAVGSGFPLNSITILGFPPLKAKARSDWFARLARSSAETLIFFESPHRIAHTLSDLGKCLGGVPICVAREMTKTHQEFLVGPANDPSFLSLTRKGEFTVVVAPREADEKPHRVASDDEIVAAFLALDRNSAPSGKRQAISLVARNLGISANDVYRAIERSKV